MRTVRPARRVPPHNSTLARRAYGLVAAFAAVAADIPANMLDANENTRWTTGTAQTPGQYFVVDMGTMTPVDAISRLKQSSASAMVLDGSPHRLRRSVLRRGRRACCGLADEVQ